MSPWQQMLAGIEFTLNMAATFATIILYACAAAARWPHSYMHTIGR